MASLDFEWDERKSVVNKKKHGVSFDEASTVFSDEQALVIADDEHSEVEDRFVILGLSSMLRILVVCHCYRTGGDVIRIISARKADRGERAEYAKRWKP